MDGVVEKIKMAAVLTIKLIEMTKSSRISRVFATATCNSFNRLCLLWKYNQWVTTVIGEAIRGSTAVCISHHDTMFCMNLESLEHLIGKDMIVSDYLLYHVRSYDPRTEETLKFAVSIVL